MDNLSSLLKSEYVKLLKNVGNLWIISVPCWRVNLKLAFDYLSANTVNSWNDKRTPNVPANTQYYSKR
jgi:hypothetical protein